MHSFPRRAALCGRALAVLLFNVGAQLLAPEACAEVLWLENAESGVGNVVTNASSYSLIQSAIAGQGESAFRLANPGGTDNWFASSQAFTLQPDSKLFF